MSKWECPQCELNHRLTTPGGGSKAENAEEETISSRLRNADQAEITVRATDEDFMNGSGL